MCFIIRGRDQCWHTVRLNYLFIPVVILLLAAAAFVCNLLYQRGYREAFDVAYDAAVNGRPSFTVKNNDRARTAVLACAFSTPEIFTVSRVRYQESGKEMTVWFEYNETAQNYLINLADFKARVLSVAAAAPPMTDEAEKAKWVHDYLVDHYSYGGGYSALSILRDGQGVCQAYTGLYTALCRELGLECGAVVSDTMHHTWNTVRVNGEWYHVDVTWDDTSGERYKYYMKNDAEMVTLQHYGWRDTGPALALITKRGRRMTWGALALSAVAVLYVLIPLLKAFFAKEPPAGPLSMQRVPRSEEDAFPPPQEPSATSGPPASRG